MHGTALALTQALTVLRLGTVWFRWLLSCWCPYLEERRGWEMLCYAVSKEGSGRFGALFAPEIALTTSWHSQNVRMPK